MTTELRDAVKRVAARVKARTAAARNDARHRKADPEREMAGSIVSGLRLNDLRAILAEIERLAALRPHEGGGDGLRAAAYHLDALRAELVETERDLRSGEPRAFCRGQQNGLLRASNHLLATADLHAPAPPSHGGEITLEDVRALKDKGPPADLMDPAFEPLIRRGVWTGWDAALNAILALLQGNRHD